MDPLEILRKAVSINSVFPNEREFALFVESFLKDIGFKVERQYVSEGRFNVLGIRGTGDKRILFYGHLDTVPPYSDWGERNPFFLEERGDRLMGLGCWDMKGGICSVLSALHNSDPSIPVKVAFCVDEENISEGGHALIKNESFFSDVVGAISTEAGNSDLGSPGPSMITLGRRGRCVYEFSVSGTSAHGAASRDPTSHPVYVSSKLIAELESMALPSHQKLPPASQFVRMISCETKGLSIPDKVIFDLDRHLVPPETKESVLNSLKSLADSFSNESVSIYVKIKERKTPYIDPYVVSEHDDFVMLVREKVRSLFGKEIINYGLSVADENLIASLGIPIVVVGPKGGNDHSPEEWMSKKSYFELISLLESVISSWGRHSIDNVQH